MGTTQRKTYSPEFKHDAVRLVLEEKRPLTEVARNLGIHPSLLQRWKKALAEDARGAFPGRGRRNEQDAEVADLRQQLARTRQERDILKKALAYFASGSK
jgi:transposase